MINVVLTEFHQVLESSIFILQFMSEKIFLLRCHQYKIADTDYTGFVKKVRWK